MQAVGALLFAVQAILLVILVGFGLHRIGLVLAWARSRAPARAPATARELPSVTVQVPLFNERYVAERVIAAVGRLDYPRTQLQIQVLDDSTDDTTAIARAAVARLRLAGVRAELLHRSDRAGFKAGALAAGLASATGELIAIFDADFVPDSDFLRRSAPYFADRRVAVVQARWGHLNADASWLTAAQSILLDGHFAVEHRARYESGTWFNFNGTAGIWRKEAIVDAGGWQADTLTEDLDLSYRAQLRGWRFVYLDDLVAKAELPATLSAFRNQQRRWATGSVQTARKLLGAVLVARQPVRTRVEAAFHLLANAGYVAAVMLSLTLPLGLLVPAPFQLDGAIQAAVVVATLGSATVFYGAAIRSTGAAWRWAALPFALALATGLAASQTRAVFDGLFGRDMPFVRTPKSGSSSSSARYAARAHYGLIELALAAAVLGTLAHGGARGLVVLFGAGYALVGAHSFIEWARQTASTTSPRPAPRSPEAR